jgi:hypothetical protein
MCRAIVASAGERAGPEPWPVMRAGFADLLRL